MSNTKELQKSITLEQTVQEHQLVVHNDEINTFDWVIQSLVEICDHSQEQAEQCAMIIHHKGRYSVQHGLLDKLQPMKSGLTDRGIGATIE
ncbi:MAG: ATP-dependent Clp protease adaptor ClpS [Chitinophagales bacterium]|nr:ATP-dependent Clp protease adaptor ClpS [Chitinophagales bacterium]